MADDDESELQAVLDALEDPACRAIIRALDRPMTAREIMTECDLSQTTTYRKLDLLAEASLVDEETEIRADGHHAARYRRAFAGVVIGLTADDLFEVTMIEATETADERLARFWAEISEGL